MTKFALFERMDFQVNRNEKIQIRNFFFSCYDFNPNTIVNEFLPFRLNLKDFHQFFNNNGLLRETNLLREMQNIHKIQ